MTNFHFAFWALALALLAAVTASTFLGWRQIRRGNRHRHRRWMNLSAALVGIFLLLYVLKVLFIGREDLSTWSPMSLAVLYTHETFIAIMLLSTSGARFLARRLRKGKVSASYRQKHRILGRIGAFACLFAFLSAVLLLRQMALMLGS